MTRSQAENVENYARKHGVAVEGQLSRSENDWFIGIPGHDRIYWDYNKAVNAIQSRIGDQK